MKATAIVHRALTALVVVFLASGAAVAETKLKADDPVEALKRRATAGDADAQVDLGRMFETGAGVPKNLQTAVSWYKKASDKGSATGMCNYGTMLIYGWGCKQDQKAALALFEKAAENGSLIAEYELGVVYEQGLGVTADYEKAVEHYKAAALAGVAPAINNLASMRAKGQLKGDWHPTEMYELAAKHGDITAEYNLGMLYLEGDGVPPNAKQAVDWLTKAAQHGHVQAMCNLGVVLAIGAEQVPADVPAAIKWLKRSANKGDSLAKQALSKIYREGRGVPKNIDEANRWWRE
jgi:TPR repeat protein